MSDSSTIDQLLQSAKLQIQLGQLDTAISTLQSLLKAQALHREGLYYLTVCQRKANNQVARETLDILKSAHPLYGRAYQEEGHLYRAEGNAIAANQAYELAVQHNPALLSSWKVLVKYRDSIGDRKAAKRAMHQVQWLTNLPPELLTATSLIHEDKLYMAEQICRYYLQSNENHNEGMRLLAEIRSKLQILDDAESLLANCVAFHPQYTRARIDYVQILHKRRKFKQAQEQASILNAETSDNTSFELTLANETLAAGEIGDALKIYDRIIKREDRLHSVFTAQGHALKSAGEHSQASRSFQRAYNCKADYGEAYWGLANLQSYRFSDLELAQMQEQERSPSISERDRIHVCFALGKALEDRQQYSESFDYYHTGNTLKRSQSRYNADSTEQRFQQHKTLFTPDFFAERGNTGHNDPAPIFIVGLPCSGSTLLEQLIASHSQVDNTKGFANIIGLAHRLNGRKKLHVEIRYPEILAELRPEKFVQFGESYIQDTQFHRQGSPYFIDKMPNNFHHIALIHLILPNAKIIDARRHPMACCFDGFTQLFNHGQEFTYDLEEVGRYYQAYVDLMDYWQQTLPGKVLKVQHEDLIDDHQAQLERILDFCELPFEQQCFESSKPEPVLSSHHSTQIAQVTLQRNEKRWQHYEEHLHTLVNALGLSLENH